MYDWVTGRFPFYCAGTIDGGRVLSLSPDGSIEWSSSKRLSVEGSHSSNITIRTAEVDAEGNTCLVELSGNPVKFLQGHNLFGSLALVDLVYSALERVSEYLGHVQPLGFYESWRRGLGTVSRIDINAMFSLGSNANVLAWLYSASDSSRTRSQSAVTRGSTVYWNKDSRRWSIKAYSKAQEIALARNTKRGLMVFSEPMIQWASDKLRIELTLKSNELREKELYLLTEIANFSAEKLLEMYREKVNMSSQLELSHEVINELPRNLKGIYAQWLAGIDIKATTSKATFYRYKSALAAYGIDISIAKPVSNVVPFVRTIELKPATLPPELYQYFYVPPARYAR